MRALFSAKKIVCLPLILTLLVSCSKPAEEDKAPTINFVTTAGHTYKDATVNRGTTFIVGINMLKSGNDLLHYLAIYCSYDGGADSLIWLIPMPPGTGASYSSDLSLGTRNKPGTEKYTFEANSYLNQKSSIGFTISVP